MSNNSNQKRMTREVKKNVKHTVKSKTNHKDVKKLKKQNKSRIVFLLFTVVIFVVILISTVFNDVLQIYRNRKETEELNNKYVELLEEEASLNSEVIKLQDPSYVERYAREKYLYTKEGEKILTIIENPNQKKQVEEEENK